MNFYIFIMDIILAQGYDIISIDYLKAISITYCSIIMAICT